MPPSGATRPGKQGLGHTGASHPPRKVRDNCALRSGQLRGESALSSPLHLGANREQYDPTIEDSYRKQLEVDGQSCMLDVMDTAGQVRLDHAWSIFTKHCLGGIQRTARFVHEDWSRLCPGL